MYGNTERTETEIESTRPLTQPGVRSAELDQRLEGVASDWYPVERGALDVVERRRDEPGVIVDLDSADVLEGPAVRLHSRGEPSTDERVDPGTGATHFGVPAELVDEVDGFLAGLHRLRVANDVEVDERHGVTAEVAGVLEEDRRRDSLGELVTGVDSADYFVLAQCWNPSEMTQLVGSISRPRLQRYGHRYDGDVRVGPEYLSPLEPLHLEPDRIRDIQH